jgi:uncharacterized protein YbbK (DUF523 family)
MKILVSACLLGRNCKYNGGNNYDPNVMSFLEGKEIVPVCPEVMAGLGVPRTPIEIVEGHLKDRQGNSVDAVLRRAVEQVLALVKEENITYAILKSRSPTCGVHQVYDGTFSGTLIPGAGVLAQALIGGGCQVVDAEEIDAVALRWGEDR